MKAQELMEKIKAKVMGSLGKKRENSKRNKESYSKMDKTASIKVEIQSRKAQRLIDKTLAAADRSAGKPSRYLPPPNHIPDQSSLQ